MSLNYYLLVFIFLFSCNEAEILKNEKVCTSSSIQKGESYAIFDTYYLGNKKICNILRKDSLFGIEEVDFLKKYTPTPMAISNKKELCKLNDFNHDKVLSQLIVALEISNEIKYEKGGERIFLMDLFSEIEIKKFKKIEKEIYYLGRKFTIIPQKLKIVEDVNLRDIFFKYDYDNDGTLVCELIFGSQNYFSFNLKVGEPENNLVLFSALQK